MAIATPVRTYISTLDDEQHALQNQLFVADVHDEDVNDQSK